MAVQVKSPRDHPGMTYRRLGNSGLFVSAIALGGWMTYGGYVAEEGALKCIQQAYDLGINFFDTAENYSDGLSEKLMGKAIKKLGWKRNDIVVSTKVFRGEASGDFMVNNIGLSRKHVIEGTKASLERLGLDYVDVISAHRPDRLTPMEETVRAFNYVIEKGWAFYWGTSMWGADEIAEACMVAKNLGLIAPIVEQPIYNMIDRGKVEGEFARILPKFGIGTTVYSPLKEGILTGKYNDHPQKPPADSRFAAAGHSSSQGKDYGNEAWTLMIDKVKKLELIANKLDCKLSQLALAWCLKNDHVACVITGASKPKQLVDNVEALRVYESLSPQVLQQIDALLVNKPSKGPDRSGFGF